MVTVAVQAPKPVYVQAPRNVTSMADDDVQLSQQQACIAPAALEDVRIRLAAASHHPVPSQRLSHADDEEIMHLTSSRSEALHVPATSGMKRKDSMVCDVMKQTSFLHELMDVADFDDVSEESNNDEHTLLTVNAHTCIVVFHSVYRLSSTWHVLTSTCANTSALLPARVHHPSWKVDTNQFVVQPQLSIS